MRKNGFHKFASAYQSNDHLKKMKKEIENSFGFVVWVLESQSIVYMGVTKLEYSQNEYSQIFTKWVMYVQTVLVDT